MIEFERISQSIEAIGMKDSVNTVDLSFVFFIKVFPFEGERAKRITDRTESRGNRAGSTPRQEHVQTFPCQLDTGFLIAFGAESFFAACNSLEAQKSAEPQLHFIHQHRLASAIVVLVFDALWILNHRPIDFLRFSC